MNGPTGLIFAMRSRYEGQDGPETFYNEVDSAYSGQPSDLTAKYNQGDEGPSVGLGTTAQQGSNPGLLNPESTNPDQQTPAYNAGQGMGTWEAEALGTPAGGEFREMGFSIEKLTVTAKSRALKAQYSMELAQDLKAIHGLNAEAELANILSSEILSEINREVVRTVYKTAVSGAQANVAHAVYLTLTLTPTVVGQLRSSKVLSSKSKETLTLSHRPLVAGRATSSSVPQTLLPL